MTTKITKIYKEREEDFDKRFKCIQNECDGQGNIPYQVGEGEWLADQCQFHAEYLFPIKSHNKATILAVLEALEEEVGGMKISIINEETLQHKYPKLNKSHSKYQKEVELVKGYNWATDRTRIVIEEKVSDILSLITLTKNKE